MAWWRSVLGLAMGGAGEVAPIFPMEYVFTEGTSSPYDAEYDDAEGSGPYLIAPDIVSSMVTYGGRKLARLSDGTLYVTHNRNPNAYLQIHVEKSVDEGANWIDETLISTYAGMDVKSLTEAAIAVDSNDHLHVVFAGKATGYTKDQIWYALYDGTWQTPIRISTIGGMNGYEERRPTIAIDSNNHIHVVWYGKMTGYTAGKQIWYALYDGSWQTPVRISTVDTMQDYEQLYPNIAVDSNDHLHVVFDGETDDYHVGEVHQIWHALYDGSWQTPVRISTAEGMYAYAQHLPSIVVDSNDHLHVVWEGSATGFITHPQIWYALYDGTWQTPIRISTVESMSTSYQSSPSIAVDENDYLHVLWHGKATGYTTQDVVWYALYTDSWATPVCLQPTGRNRYPNLRWSRWP